MLFVALAGPGSMVALRSAVRAGLALVNLTGSAALSARVGAPERVSLAL